MAGFIKETLNLRQCLLKKMCLIFVFFIFMSKLCESKVQLDENGLYSNIEISIGENLGSLGNCEDFVRNLKDILNSTSYEFYGLSQRKTYLRNFRVFLPRNSCQNLKDVRNTRQKSRITTDFFVERSIRLSGLNLEAPWAEQVAGCRARGVSVRIPEKFLDTNGGNSTAEKGLTLMREWARYRFGIFPETGFQSDRVYPQLYNEGNSTKMTVGCGSQTGAMFCPLNLPYNRLAPTKQNLFCHETSSMETILNHRDFQLINKLRISKKKSGNASEENEFENPEIEYSEPKFEFFSNLDEENGGSKYILVLERTSVMEMNDRWTSIKRSFYRFLSYLPVGSEVAIITFGKEAHLNLPLTRVTEENRDGLHGRIPRKVLADDLSCVYCALNASFKILLEDQDNLDTIPGTVIIITGEEREPQSFENLIETAKRNKIQIFPVSYPGTAFSGLSRLASDTGRLYTVPEGKKFTEPTSYLTEVITDILRISENLDIQKVHEISGLSHSFAGTFVLEESMTSDLSVTLNIDDEEKVEYFEITNPKGKKLLFSQFEDGMVIYDLKKDDIHPGIWTYHGKLYPASRPALKDVSVEVVAKGKPRLNPVTLDAFTNFNLEENHPSSEVDIYNDEVIIYARLTKGQSPVIGARVTARIFGPGANDTPVEIPLRDSGSGDTDITGQDGIYSGHFSGFSAVPGYYAVQVHADSNEGLAKVVVDSQDSIKTKKSSDCCGSRIAFPNLAPPSAPFRRQVAGPGFYVRQGVNPKTDVAPPGRVLDFRVARIIEDSLYVQLEWSAPGGDYDIGKASKYEIRCHTNRGALTDLETFAETGILVHASFTPAPFGQGQRQTSTVGVPWPNEVFYYALIALDEAGNKSPISNIISIYIPEVIKEAETEAEIISSTSSAIGGNLDMINLESSKANLDSEKVRFYAMIGGGAALIVLILLLVVALAFKRMRRRLRSAMKRSDYDADRKDAYRGYEPKIVPQETKKEQNNLDEVDVVKSKEEEIEEDMRAASAKNLSTWLDSLPRRSSLPHGHSRSNNNHKDLEVDTDVTVDNSVVNVHHLHTIPRSATLGRRVNNQANANRMSSHTLTKTNPYRHKVLTNGSFLNLKDFESSDSSGSRPTTSTEDNNSGCSSSETGETIPAANSPLKTGGSSNLHVVSSGNHVSKPNFSPKNHIIDTYSGNPLYHESTDNAITVPEMAGVYSSESLSRSKRLNNFYNGLTVVNSVDRRTAASRYQRENSFDIVSPPPLSTSSYKDDLHHQPQQADLGQYFDAHGITVLGSPSDELVGVHAHRSHHHPDLGVQQHYHHQHHADLGYDTSRETSNSGSSPLELLPPPVFYSSSQSHPRSSSSNNANSNNSRDNNGVSRTESVV